MKKRIHIFIALGIALFGFIMGSIFDASISQVLYIKNYLFGHIFAAFGLIVTYAFAAFLDGALIEKAFKIENKIYKILVIGFSIIFILIAIYICGDTAFDPNGLNKKGIGYKLLGIGIFTVLLSVFYYLGFRTAKKIDNDKLWIILLIIILVSLIAILMGGLGIKEIFHRPRYRTVVLGIEGVEFHKWWVPFKDYKNYITDVITKEEFKSFPSGHATTSMISIFGFSYLFILKPDMKRHQILLFYIGFIYSLFMSLTRILAGAHFLSDVSFGSIISILCFLIGNEIIIRKKLIEDIE